VSIKTVSLVPLPRWYWCSDRIWAFRHVWNLNPVHSDCSEVLVREYRRIKSKIAYCLL